MPGTASAIAASVVPSFFPARDSVPVPDAARAETSAAPAATARPVSRPSYATILEAIETGRIDLHVQPIVTLPQRQPRFYESFALLQSADGQALVPSEFLPTLERLRRLPRLDGLVLARAVAALRGVHQPRRKLPISCNLSPSSLSDSEFLTVFDGLLDDPAMASRLVVEISQRAWRDLDPNMLARFREAGIAVSLHEIQSFDLDRDRLAEGNVRYVKIPARTIMDAPERPGRGMDAARAVEMLAGSPVEIIAEFVEDEEIVPELIDLGVPLAQGYVFALPCPIATVFSPPPDGTASPLENGVGEPPSQPASPKGEQRPFRAFLRRAG